MVHVKKRLMFSDASPDAVLDWHPTRNSDSPSDVSIACREARWFLCHACGHEWEVRVANRARVSGCPNCRRVQRAITKKTPKPGASLAEKFPVIAAEWADDLNDGMTAADVNAGAAAKFNWRCSRGHEFELTVSYRTRTGRRCDACRREDLGHKMVSEVPRLIQDWAYDLNDIDPAATLSSGTARVVWRCHVCSHEWPASCVNRKRGTNCPNCSMRQTSTWEKEVCAVLQSWFPGSETGRKLVRYRPDLVLDRQRVVVEFDGYHWHKNRASQDEDKNHELEMRGWKVLRIRAGLPAIRPHDLVLVSTDPGVDETLAALIPHLELTDELLGLGEANSS